MLLAGADLLPVGRDFRQQVNQVPPLGGIERRQEGVGCAGERGGRLVLRAPAAGGQVTATSIILGPVKDTGVSARTLAETGLTASTAFSVSPQKVAAATLRAIGNPKAEIVVSIGPARPGSSKRSWTTSPAWARPSTGSAAATS
jgi:hypothetical protein